MKVSLKWLRDYLGIISPARELAEKLTMSGSEVKGIEVVGESWDNIVVGQVVAIEFHPNADHLKLATIDLATEQLRVVSGAPDLRVGDKVPFARVGAHLFDGHSGQPFQLKGAKIRGIESYGMACSEKELGLSSAHEGAMILPPEATVGIPLADWLGDAILDVEVTPNRPDCLSVIGIAREIAALEKQKVYLPHIEYDEPGPQIEQLIRVKVTAPDLCPRYSASLIEGIKVAPSPSWLQERLINSALRPISNIVDVTNYVMLEYGQPLHAFDYHQIGGGQVLVRRGGNGETITTLDGVMRSLTDDILVIADAQNPLAIAGIMGGMESEVSSNTTSVLLEAANFASPCIRRTTRIVRLRSEASLRFERGISPELTIPALRRATQLMLELGGGRAAQEIIDVYPHKIAPEPILLSTFQVKRLLGIELSLVEIEDVLTSLGFSCQKTSSSELGVIPPYWRTDVKMAADVIEEVARIIGYDRIPQTLLPGPLPRQQPAPMLTLKERVRDILVSCGFQEVVSYSLTSWEELVKLSPEDKPIIPTPVRVANPMSKEQEYLRSTLRANLLAILSQNQRHEEEGIRIFEVGKIYLPQEKDLPQEREMVGAVLSGCRVKSSPFKGEGYLGFFDAKGVVEALLEGLGIEADFVVGQDESLHRGRTASIIAAQESVGVIGELHPKIAKRFALLPFPVLVIEIDLVKLLPLVTSRGKYYPLPRFPASRRDIAIVVDTGVAAKKVKDVILSFPKVGQVSLFDLYSGPQVPQGKKSLAFHVVYQSSTHTLVEEEVERVEKEILAKLYHELGATLRS